MIRVLCILTTIVCSIFIGYLLASGWKDKYLELLNMIPEGRTIYLNDFNHEQYKEVVKMLKEYASKNHVRITFTIKGVTDYDDNDNQED